MKTAERVGKEEDFSINGKTKRGEHQKINDLFVFVTYVTDTDKSNKRNATVLSRAFKALV